MTEQVGFGIGDVIRQLRKSRGWSLRRLENESGIGRMTLSKVELNKANYQHETLDAIAGAFNMTSVELEALVNPSSAPPRQELAPEWVAFTRRVMHLDRHAQSLFTSLLLFCEEHRRRDDAKPDGHHQADGGGLSRPPVIPAAP